MKSRPALSFLVGFFLLLFLFFIALVVYQQKKYEKQIKWISKCNIHPKISEVSFDDFSFDKNFKVVYTDSIKILSVMESLCKAKTLHFLHREGAIESCKMHIMFENETLTLDLNKDNSPFTSVAYIPERTPILSVKTDGFNFLFERK